MRSIGALLRSGKVVYDPKPIHLIPSTVRTGSTLEELSLNLTHYNFHDETFDDQSFESISRYPDDDALLACNLCDKFGHVSSNCPAAATGFKRLRQRRIRLAVLSPSLDLANDSETVSSAAYPVLSRELNVPGCFACGSPEHILKDCPTKSIHPPTRLKRRPSGSSDALRQSAQGTMPVPPPVTSVRPVVQVHPPPVP